MEGEHKGVQLHFSEKRRNIFNFWVHLVPIIFRQTGKFKIQNNLLNYNSRRLIELIWELCTFCLFWFQILKLCIHGNDLAKFVKFISAEGSLVYLSSGSQTMIMQTNNSEDFENLWKEREWKEIISQIKL